MFESLTDEGYIPCVSLLDFQKTDGKLDMTAYCCALDFGCKAYVNLVMLHLKRNYGEGRHSLRKADFDRKVGALLFARQRKGAGDYRQRALSATAV